MNTATPPTPASITLACPLCRTTLELNPTAYAEKPCPDCGHGLVLSGGKWQGSIFFYYFFRVRCRACQQVNEIFRDPYTTVITCTRCKAELWRLTLQAEDYAYRGGH